MGHIIIVYFWFCVIFWCIDFLLPFLSYVSFPLRFAFFNDIFHGWRPPLSDDAAKLFDRHVDGPAMQLTDANFAQKNLSLAKIFIRPYLSTDWRYEMFNPRRKICKMFNPKDAARWAMTTQGHPLQQHWCYYAVTAGWLLLVSRIQNHEISVFEIGFFCNSEYGEKLWEAQHWSVLPLITKENTIGVEHWDNLEDKVLSEAASDVMRRYEKVN